MAYLILGVTRCRDLPPSTLGPQTWRVAWENSVNGSDRSTDDTAVFLESVLAPLYGQPITHELRDAIIATLQLHSDPVGLYGFRVDPEPAHWPGKTSRGDYPPSGWAVDGLSLTPVTLCRIRRR